jgi:hypothetical protein
LRELSGTILAKNKRIIESNGSRKLLTFDKKVALQNAVPFVHFNINIIFE